MDQRVDNMRLWQSISHIIAKIQVSRMFAEGKRRHFAHLAQAPSLCSRDTVSNEQCFYFSLHFTLTLVLVSQASQT